MLFAWTVCRHVRSNAIVIARAGATIGIGAGQMSRVDAVRIAIEKAGAFQPELLAGSVLASDAFFPFADGPELAVQAGTFLVQPPELGEPGPGVAAPVLERTLAQPRGQVGVARDVPGVQQSQRDLEVVAGHAPGLRDGPDGVVQPGTGVPHRVPDPVSDLGDAFPAVVQQEHVKIAAGQQLFAAVAANGDEGYAGFSPQHPGQPAVRLCSPSATISRERGHDTHQVPE